MNLKHTDTDTIKIRFTDIEWASSTSWPMRKRRRTAEAEGDTLWA
jgi:Tol biopolymer transport system component